LNALIVLRLSYILKIMNLINIYSCVKYITKHYLLTICKLGSFMLTTSAGLTRLQRAPHQHSNQNWNTHKTTRIFLFLCGKRRETGSL